MASTSNRVLLSLVLVAAGACQKKDDQPATSGGAAAPAPAAAPTDMPSLQPAELVKLLAAGGDKPLLLHVGFQKLYAQAHIPGSEYLGPTSDDATLARLRVRVADLPRTTSIVIYCGCCPWDHCPNVEPAYQALHDLGFVNAKVLFIDHDFGANWVDQGYPVATGA